MTKKIKPQTLKGFRDFLPEEMVIRQKVIDILKNVFESYGFEPLETPALEYAETLLGKYGEEADKLIYQFEDRGKRKVGLRYDLTVPLARVIAANPNLPMPFKRYQIQPVWRADKPQAGRFREFLQCDIDTIGNASLRADAEIIACALEAIKKLGLKNTKMLINDRYILRNLKPEFVSAIDKLGKVGKAGVIKELVKKGAKKSWAEKYINSFSKEKPTPNNITVFNHLKKLGWKEGKDFEFDPTLARGLDYYTSTIFELASPNCKSDSLGGGGRYDNLIGMFLGRDVPAVGFSFGIDRLIEAMKQQGLFKKLPKTTTKVLVTIFSPEFLEESIKLASKLREAGINTDLYPDPDTKLDKQLKYADRKGIPYVVILGPEEVKNKTVTVKNMKNGSQKTLSIDELQKELQV
jgi:histidyl-tRNA synthetase